MAGAASSRAGKERKGTRHCFSAKERDVRWLVFCRNWYTTSDTGKEATMTPPIIFQWPVPLSGTAFVCWDITPMLRVPNRCARRAPIRKREAMVKR